MKNLFRAICSLFILIVLFVGCSDSKEEKINNDSTIIELQEYLKKKLNKYSFQSDTTIHNYDIDFDEKNIIISHTLEMSTITTPPTITKIIVPLKEIIRLYYEEKKDTEWLTIETGLNKIGYSSDKRDNIFLNKVDLILKKEFREENYNSLSSIIPAFHKIIITKFKKNHSLQSIEPFPVISPKIDNTKPDTSKIMSNSSNDNPELDFFDERSRIYSNPEYAFSFRVPKNWVYDYGITKNNFFRAYQKDSSYSFTTNVKENKIYSKADIYSTLDIMGIEKFTQNQINAYKSQDMDNVPFDVKVNKSYLQSVKAIRTEFKLLQYGNNFNYEMSMLVYQFIRGEYLMSFVASAPTVFIDAGLIDLDLIISYFQHLPFKQNKSDQTDLNYEEIKDMFQIEKSQKNITKSTIKKISFQSKINKKTIGLYDTLTVYFKMNKDGDKFKAPDFDGFRVISGPIESVSNSWTNGERTFSKVYSYKLFPNRYGDLLIDEGAIEIDNKIYNTIPIKVTVKNTLANKAAPQVLSNIKLGDVISYTKNNIKFSFKTPVPFEESKQSFASDTDNLVVSFLSKENMTIIQVYSKPLPRNSALDANQFFSDSNGLKKFMNQMFPEPINKVNSYKVIKIGNRSFLEVSSISHDVQNQTNWITFHKNNMVNIVGITTIANFSNIESFLNKFKETIRIN